MDDYHWRFSYEVLYGTTDNPTPVGEVYESATIALNGQQARITMALQRLLGPPIQQTMLFACQDVHTGNPGACYDSDPSTHAAAGFNVGVERFPGSPFSVLPPNSDYVIKFAFGEFAETTGPIKYNNPVLESAEIKCNSSQTPVCKFPLSTWGQTPAGAIGTGNATGEPINVGLQGGQTTTISYEAVGGQELSLGLVRGTLGANTTVRAYDSNNVLLGSVTVGTTGDLDYKNGASGGTHRITFTPSGTGSGQITLFISPSIQLGAAIGGDTPTIPISIPGQDTYVTFVADIGYLVSIGLTDNTFESLVNVYIYKPDGTSLASDSVGGSGGIDLPKLPTGGNYRIRLDPKLTGTADGTGSVTLTLSTAVEGSVVVNGAATTMAIIRTAQDAYVDFQGTAQQELSLAMTDNTLMTHGTDMYVYKPDGTTLTTKIATGNPDQLDLPKLPASGTYRIRLTPRIREPNTGTGNVTFTLSTVIYGSIAVGSPSIIVTTTRPAQDAYLSFEGTAGQLLKLSLYQNSMSFYVDYAVYSPNGSQLKGGTITGTNGAAIDLPALAATGTHRIRLNPRIQHSTTFGQGSITVALAPR